MGARSQANAPACPEKFVHRSRRRGGRAVQSADHATPGDRISPCWLVVPLPAGIIL